jgi:putative nucleotidyltransferase with HDIG domain
MSAKLLSVENGFQAATSAALPQCDLEADTVEIPIKLCNLPPLSAIANQVLALSADPDVELSQLAATMQCDPAFATDVLFLANSSLFGFPSRIQALGHAIAVLGLDRIKALAVTVAMRGFISRGGPLLRQCWQHSAAAAIIAEEISPIFNVKGDVAYTIGLLHDIGRLGLLKTYAAEYSPLLGCSFETVEQVLRTERALLKVDHGVAGAWLVKSWAFPPVFVQACEHHHEPLDPKDPVLLQVAKLSCRLADAIGHSAVKYTNSPGYDDVIQSLPSYIPQNVFPSAAELGAGLEARLKSFQ